MLFFLTHSTNLEFGYFNVEIEHLPATGNVLVHNFLPTFRALTISPVDEKDTNHAEEIPGTLSSLKVEHPKKIKLSAKFGSHELFEEFQRDLSFKTKNEHFELIQHCAILPTRISDFTESCSAEITVALEFSDGWHSRTFVLPVLAPNEWFNHPSFYEALAGFVQPNTPANQRVLRAASNILEEETGSGSLEGYQSGPERATNIAAALYEALRSEKIAYVEPPASFEDSGQRVRSSSEVLESKLGTCIDLSILYAALLEQAGLHAVIFVLRGHAIVGFLPSDADLNLPVTFDPAEIINLIKAQIIIPLESTSICSGKAASFKDSIQLGHDAFRNLDIRGMLSLKSARQDGIRPLADRYSHPESSLTNTNVQNFVSRKWDTLGVLAEDDPTEFLVQDESHVPQRVRVWKKELLDLSMRNRLLNLRSSNEVIELEVRDGMLAEFEDFLFNQKPITLFPKDLISEAQKLQGHLTSSQLPEEFVFEQLEERNRVYADVTDYRYKGVFNGLRRKTRMLLEETGSSNFYLSLGALQHVTKSGKHAIAPLFLMPVKLVAGKGNAHVQLVTDTTMPGTPNYCLIEWLRQVHGTNIKSLEQPPLDSAGLDIDAALRSISAELVKARLPFVVTERSHLLIAKFSTYGMWRDLDQHWETFMENSPVFDHLTTKPGQSFRDALSDQPIEQTTVDESAMTLPVPADGSQLKAIAAAQQGRSFVLEGPPGTGKSQTITNLIAHCLNHNKKILFVAEKQAALEVVKSRLEAVGLGSYSLDLHGTDQAPTAIRQQLKNSMDTEISYDQHSWQIACTKLQTALKPLDEYPHQIHSENQMGYSLWSATTSLLEIGDGPVAQISQQFVAHPTIQQDEVIEALKELTYLNEELSQQQEAAWSLLGSGFLQVEHNDFATTWEELQDARKNIAQQPLIKDFVVKGMPLATLADGASRVTKTPESLRISKADIPVVAETRTRLNLLLSKVDELQGSYEGMESIFSNEFISYGDFEALITVAEESTKGLFGKKKKREAFRADLAAATPIDLIDSINIDGQHSPDRLVPLLKRIPLIRRAAEEISSELAPLTLLAELQGVSPLQQGFQDRARKLIEALEEQVQIAQRWPELYFLEDVTLNEIAIEAPKIEQAWTNWTKILGSTPHALKEWAGSRSWIEAWEVYAGQWESDISSDVMRIPRSVLDKARVVRILEGNNLSQLVVQQSTAPIAPQELELAVLRGIAQASVMERTANARLDRFRTTDRNDQLKRFKEATAGIQEESRKAIAANLQARRSYRAQALGERAGLLRRHLEKKRNVRSFRSLFNEFADVILETTPCVFVSPSSLANHIQPGAARFDIVIFDEASQVRVEQAMGALGRGRAAIIVGDSKQMPPTSFGMSSGSSEDEYDYEDETATDSFESLESILSEADESGLPKLWLTWHYRSRDEALIKFSNEQYYEGKLSSLPSPGSASNIGLSLINVHGQFNREKGKLNRTNMGEATAIVEEIVALVNSPLTTNDSIGVVTFNIQQRDLILDLLENHKDHVLQHRLTPGPDSIFVKNLDNVQGDERDIILFSTAFSKFEDGRPMPMNFGPITRKGGERRLNVAITRARKKVIVFTSFEPSEIDLSRTSSQGMRDLRAYMERAQHAERDSSADSNITQFDDSIQKHLAESLRERGWIVETNYGLSSFTVDLVLRSTEEKRWQVAIMLDGPKWRNMTTATDRELTPELLKKLMNWAGFVRVWLPELNNLDSVIARIEAEQKSAEQYLRQLDEMAASAIAEAERLLVEKRLEFEQAELAESEARAQAIAELESSGDEIDEDEVAAVIADKIGTTESDDATTEKGESQQWNSIGYADGSYDLVTDVEDPAEVELQIASAIASSGTSDHSEVELLPYKTWESLDLGEREEIERGLNTGRIAAVQPILSRFINENGPMPLGELRTHIAKGFDRQKVTPSLAKNIDALLPMKQIHVEAGNGDEFMWPVSLDPDAWSGVRQSKGSRTLSQVPLREIANAVIYVVTKDRNLDPHSENDFNLLADSVLKIFSLKRKTPTTKARLRDAINTYL